LTTHCLFVTFVSMETEIRIKEETLNAFKKARSAAVLTGAGVSAESGVPTFRGKDGLWRNFRAEELATPSAFSRDPKLVWEWYSWRREIIRDIKPNPAHNIIAEWENTFNDFCLITQNVDGLHAKAGSQKILELHGNIWRVRCTKEEKTFLNHEVLSDNVPPLCECSALFRPDVVWFGEALPEGIISKALENIRRCELFFVIGTSAIVEPAASLPLIAKQSGAYVIEINIDRTPISHFMDDTYLGKAGEILPCLHSESLKLRE